jgi:rSAM/selenodomain-associated transferase 1
MHNKSIILLFIKAPFKGLVKSRLAAAVGEEAALQLYKNFILDIIDALVTSGYPFRICFYPPDTEEAITTWLVGHPVMPQDGNDLGERMELAFKKVFSDGFSSAILIGSDIPDLAPAVFHEAFQSLNENDAVIGPAADGGYYLIGFNQRSFLPRIFRGISWSTDLVFQETMDILEESSLRVHLVPQWKDVDTLEDLKAFFKRNKNSGFSESRTMLYLMKNRTLLPLSRDSEPRKD